MPRPTAPVLTAAAMLLALGACDRTPRGQAAPAKIDAGAVTTPVSPGTVALSGAVRDLPPTTTPDAATLPGRSSAATAPGSAVRPPSAVDTTPRTRPPVAGETEAMRQFREEQERRDRELLERDIEASSGRAESNPRDDADARDARDDRDAYPPEDEPPYDEDLPPDDELPTDDEPPTDDMDEPPPEDEDLQWDPDTGTWR